MGLSGVFLFKVKLQLTSSKVGFEISTFPGLEPAHESNCCLDISKNIMSPFGLFLLCQLQDRKSHAEAFSLQLLMSISLLIQSIKTETVYPHFTGLPNSLLVICFRCLLHWPCLPGTP